MDEAEVWVRAYCSAIEGYQVPENLEDMDDVIADMSELADGVADEAVESFNERFVVEDKTANRPPRAPRRKGKGRGRGRASGEDPAAQD